ncbi:MAG: choice-of-anchor I family protein [Bryobacterales bacterium]|nr:choice-of-anchor I family protein [Bryobacterales bacterium]
MRSVFAAALVAATPLILPAQDLQLELLGSYRTGIFEQSAAEIPAYDPVSRRLFVVNAAQRTIDILDIADPAKPVLFRQAFVPTGWGHLPNSVAVKNGIVAAAVESDPKTSPGFVLFFDTSGNFLKGVRAGALPDMVTFTPDGTKVLTADEGEPSSDYRNDPFGTVTIVDISGGISNLTQRNVTTVDFTRFQRSSLDSSVRIFGPNASVARDLEPEYIVVSPDSKKAFVSLQENNAIAVLDIEKKEFTRIFGLGFKNHMAPGAGLDASDRDNAVRIRNWEVLGMYQPDGMAIMEHEGKLYILTANEGDARDYDTFSEEVRVSSLTLDQAGFQTPIAELRNNANLGRLTVTNRLGDADGDGRFEKLYVFGARSFSIWDEDGNQVYDSGDEMERITAERYPKFFNSNNTANDLDSRSDNKGPEPEDVKVGTVAGRRYAFVGLERIGGVMVYDITNPQSPRFVNYTNNRNFEGSPAADTAGDLGAEGLLFIPAAESPTGVPLLVVANEVSGSTSIFAVKGTREVTAQIRLDSGPAVYDRLAALFGTRDRYVQTVRLTNTGEALTGPVQLAIEGLPAGTRVSRSRGDSPAGPYLTLPVEEWGSGETLTLTLYFEHPTAALLRYTPRVFQGSF